ncbi:MAG: dockerin type I repeat-containing protein, partial [Oscillospiraceae bacterium]|nr:dockerin type I repeat-containing protein [Oscillospiraceae bacterium]
YNLNWFSINYPYENDNLRGDCNLDGAVTVLDAVMLQKWLVCASDQLTCWRNADLSGDQKIDITDLAMLKRLILGR